MANQEKTKKKSRKPPRPELEPISYEEIMANAGMSGFVSFLDEVRPAPAGAPPAESYTVQPSGADRDTRAFGGSSALPLSPDLEPKQPGGPLHPEPVELVADPAICSTQESDTVQDSSTVLQSKHVPDTVQVPNTVQPDDTVQEPDTVQTSSTVQQSNTVQKPYTVQVHRRRQKRPRIARAQSMEEGHSLAEQQLYRTLWEAGAPEAGAGMPGGREVGQAVSPAGSAPAAQPAGTPADSAASGSPRLVRLGYDRLAALARMSWLTVKTNLRSLEKKLAIETTAAEDSAQRAGKQYRIFPAAAVLARREQAGLVWVRRTRGVELLAQDSPDLI
jgi:hypothetical protein